MRQLEVKWKDWAGVPDLSLNAMHDTLVKHEKTDRMLREDAGIDEAFSGAKKVIEADYVWPYHLHASIGPSCAVAEVSASQIQVWTGSQNPHDVRKDIATLTGMAADQINVTRLEASGCYGRNCADDVASDAVLLSQAVGRPVRVQLMREQEAAWEPKGTGQLIRVRGGLDRSEEHTSELQSHLNLVCRLLLEKKKKNTNNVSNIWRSKFVSSRSKCIVNTKHCT